MRENLSPVPYSFYRNLAVQPFLLISVITNHPMLLKKDKMSFEKKYNLHFIPILQCVILLLENKRRGLSRFN